MPEWCGHKTDKKIKNTAQLFIVAEMPFPRPKHAAVIRLSSNAVGSWQKIIQKQTVPQRPPWNANDRCYQSQNHLSWPVAWPGRVDNTWFTPSSLPKCFLGPHSSGSCGIRIVSALTIHHLLTSNLSKMDQTSLPTVHVFMLTCNCRAHTSWIQWPELLAKNQRAVTFLTWLCCSKLNILVVNGGLKQKKMKERSFRTLTGLHKKPWKKWFGERNRKETKRRFALGNSEIWGELEHTFVN